MMKNSNRALPNPVVVKRMLCAGALVIGTLNCSGQKYTEGGLVFRNWYLVKPVAGATGSVGYGKITNTTASPVTLTAANLACAEKTMLHETRELSGRVTMVHLEAVQLKPAETIEFRPGQKHLMVSGIKGDIGERCDAMFEFAAQKIRFPMPVRERRE
ncbi:MAG TPA: copper chaperone PCu(A)C [Turneriella sp.]|nr:copper chaperone PCu(A)C [Turneriella sp.]